MIQHDVPDFRSALKANARMLPPLRLDGAGVRSFPFLRWGMRRIGAAAHEVVGWRV